MSGSGRWRVHLLSNSTVPPISPLLSPQPDAFFFSDQAYAHANKLFLEAVAGIYEEGDIVLVHDYDLMLLPALLRKRFPDITCGFFLHCPFPSTGESASGSIGTLKLASPQKKVNGAPGWCSAEGEPSA